MGVVIVEGEGAVLGMNLGSAIVTNGDGDALFPNYIKEDFFSFRDKKSTETSKHNIVKQLQNQQHSLRPHPSAG